MLSYADFLPQGYFLVIYVSKYFRYIWYLLGMYDNAQLRFDIRLKLKRIA